VANRGEIAVRIIRACRSLGIETVVGYSTADRTGLPARLADRAVCIGPPAASASYLDIGVVVEAAKGTGCSGLHPGYGFLSERAELPEACEEEGLVFVGPRAELIRDLGDKARARELAEKAGIPVAAGSAPLGSAAEAGHLAGDVGFPMLLKAVAGGGGRGMKIVRSAAELADRFDTASAEAREAFGDGRLYLERYVEHARHVEVQLMGDRHGRLAHLGERDCSIQRRHQKLVEETPSPAVSPELRQHIGQIAVEAARAAGYRSAGTIEGLLSPEGDYFFMEMNTRIQVEHTVTEEVTGLDLIREQVLIAAGEPLSLRQEDVVLRGHAIECRINAEDPLRNFLPSPGRIVEVREPQGLGVRVDRGIAAGSVVPPFYDPLLAKLIVHGSNRSQSIRRVRRSLDAFVIRGCHTTLPFHRALVDEPHFLRGELWTTMIADLRIVEKLRSRGPGEERVAAIAAAIEAAGRLAAGPMYALEATMPSRWARSVRADRLGGGGAIPRRRRW